MTETYGKETYSLKPTKQPCAVRVVNGFLELHRTDEEKAVFVKGSAITVIATGEKFTEIFVGDFAKYFAVRENYPEILAGIQESYNQARSR